MVRRNALCSRLVAFIAAVFIVASCQSYQPKPLDVSAMLRNWRETDLASSELAAFARKLEAEEGASGPFDLSDGVSLPEAEALALFFNADLRAERLAARVPLAAAMEAGRWADPELELEGARILESASEPWIVGAGLGFTIPLSGRLDAALERYGAEYSRRIAETNLRERETLRDLRALWHRRGNILARAELLKIYTHTIRELEAVALRMAETGDIPRAHVRALSIEARGREVELARLRADDAELSLRIFGLMGVAPDAPLALGEGSDARPLPPLDDLTESAIVERNPALLARRAAYAESEAALKLEIRKQYPDIVIGPSVESEEGQSRLGLGLGFPLPSINLNKGGIAQAIAARDVEEALFDAALRRVLGELALLRRRLAAARERRRMIEERAIPLVEEQMRELDRFAALGEFDVLEALEALRGGLETRETLLHARLEEMETAGDLRFLLPPPVREKGDERAQGKKPAEEEYEK